MVDSSEVALLLGLPQSHDPDLPDQGRGLGAFKVCGSRVDSHSTASKLSAMEISTYGATTKETGLLVFSHGGDGKNAHLIELLQR